MKKNKVFQWLLTLGLTTAACLGMGLTTASAATLNKEDIRVDYVNQKLIVGAVEESEAEEGEGGAGEDTEKTADKQVLFGVSAIKKGTLTTSAWEVYDIEDGPVIIDLSSLNTQKENYMQIKGDVSTEPITLHIPATNSKAKLQFNAVTAKVESKKEVKDTDKLEYRTQYGSWLPYGTVASADADVDLKVYQQRGASLYFRLAPATEMVSVSATEVKDGAHELPALPGKEMKVSVGKKANGPKATVDYLKQKVTIPKGALWRVNSADALGTWSAEATTAKTVLDQEKDAAAYEAIFAGGSIELKTAANAEKKKAESKVTQLAFNAKGSVNESGIDASDVTKSKITVDGKDVTAAVTESKGKYTLAITNNTANAYEVVYGADSAPAADAKVKSVKAGKTLKISKVENGKNVWIREAGDKKTAKWSTDFVSFGKIVASAGGSTGATEVEASKEVLDTLAEELFESSVTVASGTAAGTEVNLCKAGQTVTFGAAKDYTFASGAKKVKGVTITVAIPASESMTTAFFEVDATTGALKVKSSGTGALSGNVTVTLAAGSATTTKTIAMTF